ncbi:unnamed protein product [Phytomonas sp. EM1]|nr:unnamed protein product [Phytomonas sp. EM1]|eukprot:CCW62842.1 unnamed protein product [Phytomonas sp. isolate EM1]
MQGATTLMTDYYTVLGLSRLAEEDEIAKAYRRYALAYNPQCHPQDPDLETLAKRFRAVCQAYTVLSNPRARAVYDLYGEEGVKHGGTGNQGIPGGMELDGIDPQVVFKRFFGVDSPFQVVANIDGVQNNQHDFFSEVAAQQKVAQKCPPMEVRLPISLEDAFYGAMRKVTWTASHYVAGSGEGGGRNGSVQLSTESFEVRVAKGAKTGDRFHIDGRGNTSPGFARGDVVVVLQLQPHDRFRREGNDLVVTEPIFLSDALCGTTLTVRTIDGRELRVLIDEIVHPKFRTRVAGEGMPRGSEPSAPRGDLVVECDTKFPSFLTLEQKMELRRILNAK